MVQCSGLQEVLGQPSVVDVSWGEAPPTPPPPPPPPARERREHPAKAQAGSPPPTRVQKKQKTDEELLARQLLPDADPELLLQAEVPPRGTAQDFWSRMSMVDTKVDRQVEK